VPRLFDLDVPPFLVGSVLNVVIAQRLARRICQSCLYSYDPGPEVAGIITRQFRDLNLPEESWGVPKVFFRGKGCGVCNMSGYRGRMAIFEVLEITDIIKKIIIEPNFSLEVLKKQARQQGSKSMFEDGLAKVQLGLTTIEEVLRVIRE